MNTADNDVT